MEIRIAAVSLPTSNTMHANDVVNVAVALQKCMNKQKARKEADGKIYFKIRISAHSGPVIARIQGVN